MPLEVALIMMKELLRLLLAAPSLTSPRPSNFPPTSSLAYRLQRGYLKTANLIYPQAPLAPRLPVAGALSLSAPCFTWKATTDRASYLASIGLLHPEGHPIPPRPRRHPEMTQ